MMLVKHATNKQVAESVILQCPYCEFNLPNFPINFPKIITHIRVKHIKYQFPPETEFTELIKEKKIKEENHKP